MTKCFLEVQMAEHGDIGWVAKVTTYQFPETWYICSWHIREFRRTYPDVAVQRYTPLDAALDEWRRQHIG